MCDSGILGPLYFMTFQVALVGLDGFVIAGDTKGSSSGDVRQTSEAHKIRLSEKNDFVCAFAGEEIALAIAQHLVSQPHPKFYSDEVLRYYLNDETQSGLPADLVKADKPPRIELLIGALDLQERWVVWHVLFDKRQAMVRRLTTKWCCGDRINSAVYLSEAYYAKGLRVERLKHLAAHVVLAAHDTNPTEVEGLDILVAENEKPARLLEATEVATLTEYSAGIHEAVKKLLFQPVIP
jgi:hypothetical protein